MILIAKESVTSLILSGILYFHQIKRTRLQIVHDHDLTRSAGLEKCQQPLSLSLADCFALALAKRAKALLLTTDSELSKVREIEVKFFKV